MCMCVCASDLVMCDTTSVGIDPIPSHHRAVSPTLVGCWIFFNYGGWIIKQSSAIQIQYWLHYTDIAQYRKPTLVYNTCITATWIDTPSTSMWCFLLLPSREVNSLVSLVSQRPILIVTSYQLLRLSFMESPEQNQSIWTWCPFSPKLSSYLFQQSIIIEAPLTVPAVFEHWDIVEWAGSFRPGELRYIRFSIRFPATATFLLRLAQWQAEEYHREVHNTPLK